MALQCCSGQNAARGCALSFVTGHDFSRADCRHIHLSSRGGLQRLCRDRRKNFAVEQTGRKLIKLAAQRRQRSEPGAQAPGWKWEISLSRVAATVVATQFSSARRECEKTIDGFSHGKPGLKPALLLLPSVTAKTVPFHPLSQHLQPAWRTN